jgi:hypothetical protein
MNIGEFTLSRLLKVISCLVVDVAFIILFINFFALFSIVEPVKSVLMLFVLMLGLIISNAAIIFSDFLYKRYGVVHAISIMVVSIVYAVIANTLSIIIISGNVTGYVVGQLLLFALLLILYSILISFAQKTLKESSNETMEQMAKQSIMLQLMEIEAALAEKESLEDLSAVVSSFHALKERIHASTPFGRVHGNTKIVEIENRVQSNLEYIQYQMKLVFTEINSIDIKKMLDETLRLVKNREALNVR